MTTPPASQPSQPDPSRDGLVGGVPGESGLAPWLEGLELDGVERVRALNHVRALRSLEARVAPDALEGAVVASLHGGHREQRAADQLMGLSTLNAPAELDGLVALAVSESADPGTGIKAPPALDDLVARSIGVSHVGGTGSDSSGSDSSRSDSARSDLFQGDGSQGVGAQDDGAVDDDPRARGLLFHRPGSVLAGGLALLAAAGVLLVGLSSVENAGSEAGLGDDAPSGFRLVVERIDPADLSADERAFLRRTGGFFLEGPS